MSLLNQAFSKKEFTDIFGNYNDFLCYVPTNLGREMDILLMFEHPINNNILSYDILEVKKDTFDTEALAQLIDYESWFLQKKIAGDYNMLRTTAIASSFPDDVVDYVTQRESIENKPIKLVEYNYNNNKLKLNWINKNI